VLFRVYLPIRAFLCVPELMGISLGSVFCRKRRWSLPRIVCTWQASINWWL